MPKFWSKSKKKINHGEGCYSCCGLKNVTIPPWETEISDSFFAECKSLRKVVFSHKQTIIAGKSFNECKNLREVKFCSGLELIGGESFLWCEKLEKVSIPKTVTVIVGKAFQHCRGLEEINLPHSLKILEHMAFQDCRSLKQITIPKKMPMEEEISKSERKGFHRDSRVFSFLLVLFVVSVVPLGMILNYYGYMISAIIYLMAIFYGIKIERHKKKYNIQTYKEILAFTEGTRLDELERARESGKRPYQKAFVVIAFGMVAFIICMGIAWLIVSLD